MICTLASNSRYAQLSHTYKIDTDRERSEPVAHVRAICGRQIQVDDSSRRSELEGLLPTLVDRRAAIVAEVRVLMGDEWPDHAEFLRHEQDDVVQAAKAFMEVLIEIAESDVGAFPRGPEPGPQVELFEE